MIDLTSGAEIYLEDSNSASTEAVGWQAPIPQFSLGGREDPVQAVHVKVEVVL